MQALGCMPQLAVFDIQYSKSNDASAAALATPISLLNWLRDHPSMQLQVLDNRQTIM